MTLNIVSTDFLTQTHTSWLGNPNLKLLTLLTDS